MSDAVMVTHPLSLTLSTVIDLSLVGYYALITVSYTHLTLPTKLEV